MASPQHASSPESAHDEHDQHSARKRKRKTFSCDTCRRRKLKCDRELPVCGRCKKSGDAASCFYQNPPEPTMKHHENGPPGIVQMSEADLQHHFFAAQNASTGAGRQIFIQADRLAALESRIAQIDPRRPVGEPPSKRPRIDDDANIEPAFILEKKPSISTSLYGSGFRTGFFGPSSERNAASYYPAIVELVSCLVNIRMN